MDIIELASGEYFNKDFLPAGIVYKDSTGIGATEHELYTSERNSIVISPLISIVQSKQSSKVLSLYGESFRKPGCEAMIKDYFSNKGPKHKKVHITIESLPSLLIILGKIGIDVYKDFHFMLDEVHMFQTETNYRTNLPMAFDHYKKFPKSNRTCISASLYSLSDPDLLKETKTKIGFKNPRMTSFELYLTNDPIQQLGEVIKKVQGRLHIFVNSVSLALKAIDLFQLQDAAIFCGQGSSIKAGVYFRDFTPNPTNEFCFYTTACFTGCDIYSDGIQIVLTGKSPNRDYKLIKSDLVQVLGRLRKNSKSRVIIATHENNNLMAPKINRNTIENIAASEIVDYSKNLNRVTRTIIKTKNDDSDGFVRLDIGGNPVINYPRIDNVCQREHDLYNLYLNDVSMKTFLSKYGSVNIHSNYFNGSPIPLPKSGRKSRISEFNTAVIKINNYENDLVARLGDTSSTPFDSGRFQKEVVSQSQGIEKKFLQEYMKYPDPAAFYSCNGDLDVLKIARIRNLIKDDGNLFYEIDNALPIGKRLTVKSLIPVVKKLLKPIKLKEKVTIYTVKRLLRYFREFKEVQISQKKNRGVEIVA